MAGYELRTLLNMTAAATIKTTAYTGSWIYVPRYKSMAVACRTVSNNQGDPGAYLDAGMVGNSTTTFFATQYTTLNADLTTTANTSMRYITEPMPQYVRVRITNHLTTTNVTRVRCEALGRY